MATLLFYDPATDTLAYPDGSPYPPRPVTALCGCHTPPRLAVAAAPGGAWIHEDDPRPGWRRGATVRNPTGGTS